MAKKRPGPSAIEKKPAAPRKHYDPIESSSADGHEVYTLINEVREKWRECLAPARIGAAWAIGRRADKDGHITLGSLKRCNELDRRLHELDFIVVLAKEPWEKLVRNQRLALVHHVLCQVEPIFGSDKSTQAKDGHGQLRWRPRTPDVKEFSEVGSAHGCWVAEIASFVEKIKERDPNLSLFSSERNDRQEKAIGKDTMAPAPPS